MIRLFQCRSQSLMKHTLIGLSLKFGTLTLRPLIVFTPVFLLVVWIQASKAEETLPPLKDGQVPQTIEEIWGDYDPRQEPLEAETLKEWETDGVVCRIVRFRIGVFKGSKSVMAGLYAFPKGGERLPGLIQVHGGGQSANLNAAVTNARRGYACISLNWGGNQLNDGNHKNIWENAGTDWGAVDGTHPPKRDPINHFAVQTPNEFTLDAVESPRNSSWLLVAIGVRRGLTFLEQQPEVDGSRLGIYGHSMGGKLTVMVAAIDARVRAAVPSCGGITDFPSELHWENSKFCQRLKCPVLFINPVNDFYGRVDDLNKVVATKPGDSFRFACAPNLDHRDKPEHFVCGPLWFDQHLKGSFTLPQTPETTLELKTERGIPLLRVSPDASRTIQSVDVYFNQHPRDEKCANPCWRHVKTVLSENSWTAELPLHTVERPLRVYANVRYALESPIIGAGYYYGVYTAKEFTLSSRLTTATPEMLRESNVQPSDQPSLLIEAFEADWQQGWYSFNENGDWPFRTNKIQHPKWKGPNGARFVLEVQSTQPNTLVLQLDQHAASATLLSGDTWQTISLRCADFLDANGDRLGDWATANELAIVQKVTLKQGNTTKNVGAVWLGDLPRFRQMRWELDEVR